MLDILLKNNSFVNSCRLKKKRKSTPPDHHFQNNTTQRVVTAHKIAANISCTVGEEKVVKLRNKIIPVHHAVV